MQLPLLPVLPALPILPPLPVLPIYSPWYPVDRDPWEAGWYEVRTAEGVIYCDHIYWFGTMSGWDNMPGDAVAWRGLARPKA